MARIVELRGQTPSGWPRERWEWLKRVRGDGDLSPIARLVACSLGFAFANSQTGECRPGYAAIAKDCATSTRTIERAMADLERAGWIARKGGEGHRQSAAIVFQTPWRACGPETKRPTDLAVERPTDLAVERPTDLAATPASSDATPCTPYKDKPNLNQKARATSERPVPHLAVCIHPDTAHEAAWNAWLVDNGFQTLNVLGIRSSDRDGLGWDAPFRLPPRPDDRIQGTIAMKWANWATFRMMERRNA